MSNNRNQKRINDILIKMAATAYRDNLSDQNEIINKYKMKKEENVSNEDSFQFMTRALSSGKLLFDKQLQELKIRIYSFNDTPMHIVLTDPNNQFILLDKNDKDRLDDNQEFTSYNVPMFNNSEIKYKKDDITEISIKDFRINYYNNIESVCLNRTLNQNDISHNTILDLIKNNVNHREIKKIINDENNLLKPKEEISYDDPWIDNIFLNKKSKNENQEIKRTSIKNSIK